MAEPRRTEHTEPDHGGIGPAGVPGLPTGFTCPRCGGVLGEADDTGDRLECRVGHTVPVDELADAKRAAVEDALWAAVRSLDEKAALSRRLSERAVRREDRNTADHHRRQARAAERRSAVVRRLLHDAEAGRDSGLEVAEGD